MMYFTHTIFQTSERKTYWKYVGIFGNYFFWALNKGLCQKYKMHETWSNAISGAPFNIFFFQNNGHYPNLLKSQNIAMISKMWQTLNTLEQLDCAEDSQQGALSALFKIRSNLTILNCTNGKHTQYMGTHTDKIQNVSHACVVSSKENVFF